MLDERLVRRLADAAAETDRFSVVSRRTVLNRVRERLKVLPANYRDKAAYGVDTGEVARRDFLKLLGLGAVSGAVGVGAVKLFQELDHASVTGYASGDCGYETVPVSAGDTKQEVVGGGSSLENRLYDVTADGAGVTFRLKGDSTLRNIGIKGKNQSDKFIFRIGGGVNATIDRVYTEHFDSNAKSIGGILATKSTSGTVNVTGATIKGFGNDATYFSKADAQVTVEDCYLVNNRTANFRGGGNYHGNNRDHIFRNCRVILDDLTDVALYPSGGNRTAGFIARWGEIEMHDCHCYLDPNAPDPVGSGTISSNSYCIRTDGNTGNPAANVYDSEISPKDRISGNVNYVRNVGSNPEPSPPAYAPASAEQAACGEGSGGTDSTSRTAPSDTAGDDTDGTAGNNAPC